MQTLHCTARPVLAQKRDLADHPFSGAPRQGQVHISSCTIHYCLVTGAGSKVCSAFGKPCETKVMAEVTTDSGGLSHMAKCIVQRFGCERTIELDPAGLPPDGRVNKPIPNLRFRLRVDSGPAHPSLAKLLGSPGVD
jgi:hypothetical protein